MRQQPADATGRGRLVKLRNVHSWPCGCWLPPEFQEKRLPYCCTYSSLYIL